jgi:hypothetical protein
MAKAFVVYATNTVKATMFRPETDRHSIPGGHYDRIEKHHIYGT